VPERAARHPRYVAALTAVAGIILLLGAFLRPQPDASTSAAPPPSEMDLLRLARLSQRRSLENMTAYFSSIADEAARALHYVSDRRTSGVAWSQDLMVAPWHARTTLPGPEMPLVAMDPPADMPLVPAPRAPSLPRSGDWVVAVWQSASSRAFAPGTYLQSVEVDCGRVRVQEALATIALTPTMAGGALFDVDGQLLAVLLRCGDRVAAVDAAGVEAMLEYSRSPEARMLEDFGFRASPPTLDEAAHFQITDGALVREVWDGHPADLADLRPGDVISTEDFQRLLSPPPEGPAELAARRGSRMVKIVLSRAQDDAAVADSGPPEVGLMWEARGPRYPIESVVPGSAADRAGMRSGDVIVRINHVEPKDLAQVRRLLAGRGSKTAFVELARGHRRIGVLVF
jgi:hypothetical protein